MIFLRQLPIVVALLLVYPAIGQMPVTMQMGGVKREMRVNEQTVLFDKSTGQRVSYQEYQQRMKTDPYGYHLEPVYDEYGTEASYTIRPTTVEEKTTHRFYERDTTKQPKVGQPIEPFVMTGLDGKTYPSTDMLGNVVVLSFWIGLEKPFWNDKWGVDFGNAVRPFQSETSPVMLGVMNSRQPQVVDHLTTQTLPFMPVPNAYGFHGKYQIKAIPTFIVIDKTGKVAAYIEGQDYPKLKEALSTISR